ncbi:MAG: hypothetical protein LUC18_01065, partial [Porphyromonadaceae bacterium]|nr:hypothetical protein [Porphyromonadaceae bacterium]
MKKVLFFLLILPFFWTGCDTTSKLGADEVLYTGVKKMHIRPEEEGAKITSNAESAVRSALSVKPNNALYSPYVRWPFPFGLWVYNHVEPQKDKGFKHWFYDRFSKKPVLLSTVQPDLRVAVIPDILANYGYFLSSADYSLIYNRKNPQKSRITYDVTYGKPWRYTSIDFPQPLTPLTAIIDSAKTKTLLHVGDIYQSEILSSERTRVTSALRNRGYYFFRPDYLYYLADTTFASHEVALRLQLRSNIPMEALQTYRIGHITFDLKSASRKGAVDSVGLSHVKFVYQKPLKVRKRYIDRNITLKEGELYTLDHQNESLNSFSRMGIFRYVNLSVSPADSTIGNDILDLTFDAAMDSPMEAWFETDVTSATNSFIGPGVIFGVAHKNIFGGGERLSIELSGSYEWQTGKRQTTTTKTSLVNSYEFGIKASLVFPRLLPSSLLWDSRIERRYGGKTTLELGADLMNRPQYFRMLSLNASFALDFQTSSVSSHTVQL